MPGGIRLLRDEVKDPPNDYFDVVLSIFFSGA